MKASLFAALVVLSMLHAPRARARLDETLQQCASRYGAPWSSSDNDAEYGIPNTKTYYYKKGDFEISISFFQGRAADIHFAKEENAVFTEAEIQTLLTANRGTSSWGAPTKSDELGEDGKPSLSWERADGASAYFAYTGISKRHTLLIQNKAYRDERNRIVDAQIAADKKAKANGAAMQGF